MGMRIITLSITLLACSRVLLAASPAGLNKKAMKAMPKGFQNLALGMSRQQLKALRPEAESVAEDEEGAVFMEGIGQHNAFSDVVYAFRDNKLTMVRFWAAYSTTGEFRKRRVKFLADCAKKWGRNFERHIVLTSGFGARYLGPLLLWDDGDFRVCVLCTPEFEYCSLSRGTIELTISSLGKEQFFEQKVYERKHVPPEVRDKIFKTIWEAPDWAGLLQEEEARDREERSAPRNGKAESEQK